MKDILEEIREMNNRDRQKEEEKYYKKLCDQYNEALTCMGLDYEDSDPLLVSNMMKELTSRRVTGRILSVFHELSVYREIGTTDKCKKAMEGLAEYEKTGLTPQQIVEIIELYQERCKELARFELVKTATYAGQEVYVKKGSRVEKETSL